MSVSFFVGRVFFVFVFFLSHGCSVLCVYVFLCANAARVSYVSGGDAIKSTTAIGAVVVAQPRIAPATRISYVMCSLMVYLQAGLYRRRRPRKHTLRVESSRV